MRSSRVILFLVIGVSLPALIALLTLYGDRYLDFFLPIYRWGLAVALPDFSVLNLSLSEINGELMVAANVLAMQEQVIQGHHLPAAFSVSASTLAAHAYKHVIVMIVAVLLWPRLSIKQRLLQLSLSFPLLVLVELFDIPLVLAGAVRDLIAANLAPESLHQAWTVVWMRLKDGGGRFALPVAAAVIAAQLRASIDLLLLRRIHSYDANN